MFALTADDICSRKALLDALLDMLQQISGGFTLVQPVQVYLPRAERPQVMIFVILVESIRSRLLVQVLFETGAQLSFGFKLRNRNDR